MADSGRQIREYWSGPGDLAEEFRSAITLGLMLVVTNQASDGEVEFRSALYDQDVEVPYSPAPQWLPVPDGMALVDRSYPTEEELSAAFADPRWTTLHSRAFWVWVQEEGHPDSASVEIVVEHFDRALDVREAFRQFQVDDDGDPESRGPLTVRNRFDLYCTLLAMTADLDTLVSDWKHSPDSVVRDDMPLVVHDQPRKWWAEVAASTDRLLEASRTGSLVELEPRSVAEEVLLALATRTSYVAWGHDTAELVGVYPPVETLPRDVEWDGRHEEILPHLVGDVDVEMLWDRRLDGIGDPSDTVNVILRIGDLRPAAWHHARNA
ncbi:MAG: hypothetical protein BGO38_01285 [Cellulomonas sp. 73-145]|nr:MAG: hypothetical protein BGO38_01285 [Cellulomonas sp. 73-145]